MSGPSIYNIFPPIAGTTDQWVRWAEHARRMGFDWIYLNPIQAPGFSGSLYSIKDYYRVNPVFLKTSGGSGYEEVELAFREMRQLGLNIMVDLVINHTAIDSPLVKEHPEWYSLDEEGELLHPSAIDPADARNVTVWGDLYEIDNEASTAREALWAYWSDFVRHLVRLGVQGFRCDAAYKVPAPLWARLIEVAREAAEGPVLFFAETLGCRLEEVAELAEAGFDYLYNSSKYWNFDASWALEQHESFQRVAPSVAFPESHDTERLFVSCGGRAHVMQQRIAVTAIFSAGLQATMGMEYGWKKPCDVMGATTTIQEAPGVILVDYLRNINAIRRAVPVFSEEGHFAPDPFFHGETILLEKRSGQHAPTAFIVVNKNWDRAQTHALPEPLYLLRPFRGTECSAEPVTEVELEPAEVVYGFRERVML